MGRKLHSDVMQPTLQDVARLTMAVRASLPAWCGGEAADRIEIGIAEALTNIVEHGFADRTPQPVPVAWGEADGVFEVLITDTGSPIPEDLLASIEPDTTFGFDPTDFGSIPESGMGLALVKAAFDTVDYTSRGGVNRLRLRKLP